MKKNYRKYICTFLLITIMLPISTAYAATVVSDNKVHMGTSGNKYYAQAYFNPSHKVEKGEGYSLTSGKYVKQAYVRATSNGSWLCGSADTGRQYSALATSKIDKIISTSEAKVSKCMLCVQKTNYGWQYF